MTNPIDNYMPHTGRYICENGDRYNVADHLRNDFASIARRLSPGKQVFGVYGERTTSGAETNYMVWPNGPFSIPPAAGVQMVVQSTSANDAVGGTNIRTVRLIYLDSNLNQQTENVSLNGTSPVNTTATDIRFIQCMHLLTFGTTPEAAGVISASNGGNTYSAIEVGKARCSSSAAMVPAGKRLYISGAVGSSISGTSAAKTELRFVSSELNNELYNVPLVLFPLASIGVQDGGISYQFNGALSFSAGAVVGLAHTSDKAATISASWFGWLEDV